MRGYVGEQKVTDWQMDAWTLWTCDIEKLGKMWRMTCIISGSVLLYNSRVSSCVHLYMS